MNDASGGFRRMECSEKLIAVFTAVITLGVGRNRAIVSVLPGDVTAAADHVLDDALARQVARVLRIRITGTLGVLIDAKRAGFISAIAPQLDELQSLGFRLAAHTRAAALKIVGEPSR